MMIGSEGFSERGGFLEKEVDVWMGMGMGMGWENRGMGLGFGVFCCLRGWWGFEERTYLRCDRGVFFCV